MTAPANTKTLLAELAAAGIKPDEFRRAASAELARRLKADYYLSSSWTWFSELITPKHFRADLAPFHQEVAKFIEGMRFPQKLILLPREHTKTAQITIGETIRYSQLNPDARILICSFRQKKACSFLTGVKGHLLKPQFRSIFGELLPAAHDRYHVNTDEQLTLMSRLDLSVPHPTFSTSGVDKSETSGRYDLIVCDDMIVELHADNMELIEKTIKYWENLLDLLDKRTGQMWIVGTRHHPLDLYGYCLENFVDRRCKAEDETQEFVAHAADCSCDFDVLHKELKDDAGNYIFPARFNPQVDAKLLRQKGPVGYSFQYLNRAVSNEMRWISDQKLDSALCDPSEIMDLKSKDALIWIETCDPAESKKKRSAFTGLIANGVHKETGVWYIDLAEAERLETGGFIDFVFKWHRVYRPYRFGMENNTRKAMAFVLEQRMMVESYYFTIDELTPNFNQPDDKKRRFRQSIVPLFNYGRIRVNRTLKALLIALSTVPQCRYWDLLDCLSYQLDLAPKIGIAIDQAGAAPAIQLPERVIGFEGCGY